VCLSSIFQLISLDIFPAIHIYPPFSYVVKLFNEPGETSSWILSSILCYSRVANFWTSVTWRYCNHTANFILSVAAEWSLHHHATEIKKQKMCHTTLFDWRLQLLPPKYRRIWAQMHVDQHTLLRCECIQQCLPGDW
jgi:hypothetical protein